MPTIMRDDDGMLVEATSKTHGTYYYVADSMGTPFSDGWSDKDDAVAAFEAGAEKDFIPPTINLNERGIPTDEPESE